MEFLNAGEGLTGVKTATPEADAKGSLHAPDSQFGFSP